MVTPRACAAVLCAGGLLIAGCGGGSATAEQQRQVKQFLPSAHDIRRVRDGSTTRCEGRVGNALVGERWQCEFTVSSGGGSQSCWSDHGSRESLRIV